MNRYTRAPKNIKAVLGALAIATLAAACGSSTSSTSSASSTTSASGGFTGTVAIGESTTLSGAIAELGQTGLQGVQLAAADINAKGGLLGKKVTVVSADDGVSPSTGASNARSMILNDHVVALFGPVVSSIAAAEEAIAAQYKVPIFFHTSNDVGLLTKDYTKYAFQVVPNTIMEPRAAAAYLAQQVGDKQITIGTFAPDYSFGHDTVSGFIQALKDLHVNYKLVAQQFPPLTATNIAPYLSALTAANPQYVFNAQFGGDLVNFSQQANQYGFFNKTKVIAMYSAAPLAALGSNAPAGAIGFDRAPYWAINTPAMSSFNSEYKAKYNSYPSAWAIMAYTAVQAWAQGVRTAKSFSGDPVSNALSGATVSTIRGPLTLRSCDHQANVPEYVGTVSSTVDPTYGQTLWNPNVFTAQPNTIMLTCAQSEALRG